MKYCPNPSCRHAVRFKSPAEFTDHATTCNDCLMELVDRHELDSKDTQLRVQAFHDAQSRKVEDARAEREVPSGRANIATGGALLALGLALFVGPMLIPDSSGNTKTFAVSLLAMGYGVYRLERGFSERRASKKPPAPPRGPYRT